LQRTKYEISETRSAKNVVTEVIDLIQLNGVETFSQKCLIG